MTKQQAQELYNHYDTMVKKLTAAKVALVDGGVQSYTIDDRSLTRFDLDRLSAELEEAIKKRDAYASIVRGGKARKAFGVVPRDF